MTGVNVFARLDAGFNRAVGAGRRHSAAFDHFWRAKDRYGEVLGGRLAAAISYYGFFAIFALGLVGYAVFGFVLRHPSVRDAVVSFLSQNLPWLQLENIEKAVSGVQTTGRPIGIVGLIGLTFTGIAWVEAIRSSQRAVYGYQQNPGNIIVRKLIDFGVLLGVFVLLAISVGAVDGVSTLLRWLAGGSRDWLGWVTYPLALVVNMVIAFALLGPVPRLRMSVRRLLPPLLIVGAGLTALNTVGRLYIGWVDTNAAYALVGPVGLLVYLYLFNQVLIWAAAIAATDNHGTIRDLNGPREAESANGP